MAAGCQARYFKISPVVTVPHWRICTHPKEKSSREKWKRFLFNQRNKWYQLGNACSMSETNNSADCLIISSREGEVNKMALNFSRSIIAVYFLLCFYCHFLNRVTVGQGNFRKSTNNQVQNWQSTQWLFAKKKPHNHYLLMKAFSCQSRGSPTKYFSCIVNRKVVFQDLLMHLFKDFRATTFSSIYETFTGWLKELLFNLF